MTGPVPMKPSIVRISGERRRDLVRLVGLVGVETHELRDDLALEGLGEAVAALFERHVRLFLTTAQDLGGAELVEALTSATASDDLVLADVRQSRRCPCSRSSPS